MSAPTRIEQEHYAKLVGRTVVGIQWQDIEGQPLPVLLLNDQGRDGQAAYVIVLADPECNAPGFLDHNL